MQLSNLYSIPGEKYVDILVEKGKISAIKEHASSLKDTSAGDAVIEFTNALVFPGLINSHDHLDFNLFPQLGNKIYTNYVEWGEDIHRQNKDVIDIILKVPKQYRLQWGIYKNLLNGITTVVNHGPRIDVNNEIITVWQNTHSLHSVKLEKRWKYKLNMPFAGNMPFSIHIGEGSDKDSTEEIDTLIKWNLFKRKLIGIHGVAMNEKQASAFNAIIWCPDSNYFLLNSTAPIDRLKHKTKILFGTDSTVSSRWSIWEHLRLARDKKIDTDAELMDMLTILPAQVWDIPLCGKLAKGYDADIVIARKKADNEGMGAFFTLNAEDILMVIHKGNIRLFDEELYQQLNAKNIALDNFHKVYVKGNCKYVYGNLPHLIKTIQAYSSEVRFPVSC